MTYIGTNWLHVAFPFVSCYHVMPNWNNSYEMDDQCNYLSFYHTDQYLYVM